MSYIVNDKPGVYGIFCKTNEKFYIGSSKGIQGRLTDHLCGLKLNKHYNGHLQKAWNLYGEDDFIMFDIEYCEEHLLLIREDMWVRRHNAHKKGFGFNKKLPLEDYDRDEETNEFKNGKGLTPIICIITKTAEIKKYYTIIQASKDLSLTYAKIINVLSYWKKDTQFKERFRKSYKGYVFVYEDEYDPEYDYFSYKKERSIDTYYRVEKKEKVKSTRHQSEWCITRKPIIVQNVETGETQELESIADCIKNLAMNKMKIYKLLKNDFGQYQHKGYFLKYKQIGDTFN